MNFGRRQYSVDGGLRIFGSLDAPISLQSLLPEHGAECYSDDRRQTDRKVDDIRRDKCTKSPYRQ